MPPLTALRAFEAAGRLGGFAPAAHELGVTPGAVTAHLKTLETQLGAPLFQRHHRGVTLTELGARALPEFTDAFAALSAAVSRLEAEAAPDVIRIATTPDLAMLWLSSRLPGLRAKGARIVPVIVPDAEAAKGRAEIAVFLELAASDEGAPLVAIAAPGFVPVGGVVARLQPETCLSLGGVLGDWRTWLKAANAELAPRGAVHDQAGLAVEEVANGAGVLVIPLPLAEAALKSGRVVEPFDIRAPSGLALKIRALKDVSDMPLAIAALSVLQGDQGAIK